jgi:signal transduction histidine kinase
MLAFVAVSLISTLLVVGFTRWRSGEEFRSFLIAQNRPGLVVSFADYFHEHGSWEGISSSTVVPRSGGPSDAPFDSGPFTLVDSSSSRVVLAGEGYRVGAILPAADMPNAIQIESDHKTVGFLLINRPRYRIGVPGSAFLDRINFQTLLGGLAGIALALLLALALTRSLTRPVRELTAATRALAEGGLGHQVPVRSHDELGQLAASFNRMSRDLVQSLNLRRQMTADVAHELRTPISIILGHAEAVHDGVLPASGETFEIIREEAGRLGRLVDDLHTLSLADAGELVLNLVACSPLALLQGAHRTYTHQASQHQVSLELVEAGTLPQVRVDPQRMQEVFANVINNAIRYTPRGGQVLLSAQQLEREIEFRIHDTGPGLEPAELDRIFERFHRVQGARTREEGGSGLGLAIARSIVDKHQGRIWAESPPGAGLTIVVRLPISPPEDA